MRSVITFCAIFFLFPTSVLAGVFDAQTSMLSNGLQIVLIENHRAPVVTHMLWYKIGGADEPEKQSGLTHFLEHLMFKGTTNVASGEFSKRVAAMGGNDNAFTTHDATAYYQSVARQYLPVVMAMEADRMRNLSLTESDIEAERKVVLQERKERYDNNPSGRFWEQVATRAFFGHPYARPVIGTEEDIKNLTKEQIIEYYKQWYVPNNAILVVSGDVSMDELIPLAQKYYGTIEANWELPSRVLGNKKVSRSKTEVIVKNDPQVKQAQWTRIYPVPAIEQAYTGQADALSVFANIFGSGTTSILYKKLVVEKKIAAHTSASYDGIKRSVAQFGISVVPVAGVSMDDINEAVDEVISELVADGVNASLIADAKEKIITSSDYARDSLDGPPTIIGRAMISGVTLPDIERFPERIENVDKISIDDAMRKMFNHDKAKRYFPHLTAYLLPEQKDKEQ